MTTAIRSGQLWTRKEDASGHALFCMILCRDRKESERPWSCIWYSSHDLGWGSFSRPGQTPGHTESRLLCRFYVLLSDCPEDAQ